MLLKFTKCLIQSITEAMVRLKGSLIKDLLLWMESQVISCNQGDVPGYNTLESFILLLIQVPNKKQSRNFWGFQFVKHSLEEIFSSSQLWQPTGTSQKWIKPLGISGCFHTSQFLNQGQYYLSWEGVHKLVLFIGFMFIQRKDF